MTYILTNEGKRYLKEGLPEKRLIGLIKDRNGISIKDANSSLGTDFAIALQWCKKLKCVEVINGKLILTGQLGDVMAIDHEGVPSERRELSHPSRYVMTVEALARLAESVRIEDRDEVRCGERADPERKIGALEVAKETSALADHHEKAAA